MSKLNLGFSNILLTVSFGDLNLHGSDKLAKLFTSTMNRIIFVNSHPFRVKGSLDKELYNNYCCLVVLNKQQINCG